MNFVSAVGGAMNAHDAYRRADQAEELQKMQLEAHRSALDDDKLAREVTRMVYADMAAKKAAAKKTGAIAPIAPIAAIPSVTPQALAYPDDGGYSTGMANGGQVKRRYSGVYDDTAVNDRLPTVYQQRLKDLEAPPEERGNMRDAWSEIKRHITAMADGGGVTNGVGTMTNFADGGAVNRFTGYYEENGQRYETYRDAAGREWKDNGKDAPSLTPDSAAKERLRQQRDDQRRDKAESKAPTTKTEMGKGMANGGPVHKTIFDFMHHHLGKKKPKGAVQMKKGGMVRGPGTGTSDSVKATGPGGAPYKLSNGEYVLSADTVRAVGKHNLDALQAKHHKPVR